RHRCPVRTSSRSGLLGECAVVLLQGLGGGGRIGLPADDLLQGRARGVGEGGGGVVEVGQQGALGGDGVEGLVDVLVHARVRGELGGAVHRHAAVLGDHRHRVVAGDEVDEGGGRGGVLRSGGEGEGDAGAAGGRDRPVGPRGRG